MIRPTLTCKKLFLAVVLSFFGFSLIAADRYSVATGNWNDISTWSATSGGASGASFPIAGDNVFIEGGFTVTTAADAACANLSIANGATLSVAGFNITVSGTTTLNGTINHTSTTGTKTFTGLTTINATGIWNNNTVNAPINFRGGVSNSGAFNAGTGIHTFNTNNQSLTGTLSIPNVTVTGVTLTNNGILTVSAALAGTGGLTQAVNATLNLGGTSVITTLTSTNIGNTVNFSGAAQTGKVSSYYNLTLSGTGVKTFATTPTVNGILSMEGTATVVVTAGVVTYGANATLQYNTATARTATAEEWIVPFAATGGVIIANTGTITMNVAKVFSASVPLTIISGATLATNNLQLTLGGNFVNGGSLSAGSSPIVITNTMAAQNIDGFTTTGVVLLSKTAGTATFTGNVSGNGLTINGNGGTLNLGTGLTHTFTGAWTNTIGTLNGGSSILILGNNGTFTAGTFTCGTGTVNYNAAGVQTVAGVTYNNLTISGSGTKTPGGAATVEGTLTLTSGSFALAGNTLTLNGPTIAGTPANLVTTAASNITFGGSTAGVLIPTSVVALNGLSITNTNIVTLQSSVTVSGTFNPAGAGLSIGANTLTLNGIINCGTLVGSAASDIIVGGAGAASLPGVILNNLTVNRAVTMCGSVTVGGTLTLTSGALSIAANTLTLSDAANLSYGAGSLTGGVTSNLTIGTGADITLNAIANGLNNFNTSRNITLGADLTVNGTLTLTAGSFTIGTWTLTLNGPTIAGTPANLVTTATSSLAFGGTTAGVLIPTSVVALNGLSITNTNIVTLQSSLTISGTFNPAGAGLSIGANTLTLNGIINCGTLVGGAISNIIIGGAGAASLPGVTLNNLTINRAVTMCGNVSVGGTLTLTSGALSIAANTLTLLNGANLSYGAGSLTGGVTSNLTIGTGTDITLNAIANGLNNFNTSRNIALGADLTVNGTLTLTAGTLTVGARTLTLNGPTIAGTPATLVTTATSSLAFGGTTAGVLIPTSVVALNGLSITNTNIVTLQSSPTVSGTFNPAGAGLSIGANTLTLNGIINCGTLIGGATSNIIVGAGGAAATLPGVTLNNLTINRNVSLCGNVTVGGTLTLTSGALSIAPNNLTLLNGANLSYGGGSLTGGVTSNLTIGTGANITLNAIANGLNNFNTSRNITLGADLTVSGTLTLTAGTFTVGPRTLTLNGPAIAGTPGNLIAIATSGLSFGGSSSGVFIPASVTNLANLAINNAIGVTMNSNITLAAGGVLTLTSGIIQAGTNTLKITNTNPATAIVWTLGSFVNITTGSLERTLTANLVGNGNNYLFPIGDGGAFKGINLRDVNTGVTGPVLRATVSATGALTGDGTTIGLVDPRYWSLINLNSGNLISAKVELYESGLDFSKTIGMSSAVAGNYIAIGGSSNTSSIISPTVLNPGPYFCIGASIQDTYYSYQTGSWNNATTWTSDPSGTLQIGTTIPGDNDKVVILTGRTVSLPADVTTLTLDVTIDAGGFLDQTIYKFTNSLYAIRGQGTVRLASANFPASVINTFINAGGGTTEYNNTANFTLSAAQTTYNNLTINTAGFTATQLSNITLNGDLYVKSGTFQINNNVAVVKLNLTINGNVTVDNGAFISVGNGPTNPAIGAVTVGGVTPFINYYTYFHTVIVKGNFTNNGTVRFTNLPYPIYNAFPPTVAGSTTGAASVYFQGASNNTLDCNGITDFYNLILDKGIDQTFMLTINSTNYANFRLFGANTLATEAAPSSNPNIRKAFWIRTGTLVLKGSLIIPSLSEGIAANSDYYIPSNGSLIVDGVDVVVLSSADDYREINTAYTVTAPDNATIGVTKGGFSAMDIFGKLQINNGYLSARESGGLITSNIASGQFIINGGTIDAKQLLSFTGSASYTQTGGIFILRGRFQRTPASYSTVADLTDVSVATLNTSRATNGISTGFGSFNLEQTTNIFSMSGGTIRIYDVCGITGVEQKAFDVKSSTSNINVTGGTLEIRPYTGLVLADAGNYYINTSAPLFNLLIDRSSSASVVQLNTSPLVVLNDLTLASGVFSANNLNVTIGRNFSIAGGTSYTPGTNITIFNGTGGQTFTVNVAAPLSLNKLTIDKPAGIALNFTGTQSTINVADNFSLVLGTINDNGNTINIAKNVYNSGIHNGNGKIVLNGTQTQTIDGNGVFGNLELNNTNAAAAPVSLIANSTINGNLTFSQDKLLNIATYNLKLNATASVVNIGSLRYIKSAGNAGDGGLTRVYASPSTLSFPVGVVNYTPASIGLSAAPTAYGSITVIPVNYAHPNVTAPGRSLTYFWRVKSSGFTLGTAAVTHGYSYDQSNVVTGGDVTENEYVAARFNSSTSSWTKGTPADVDETNNIIGEPGTGSFLENVPFIDGDYTAGDDNPASPFGIPTIYYSRQSGLWSNVNTWSLTSHTVNNPPAVEPGASDIVIIGDNDIVTLATNLTIPNTGVQNCASLKIENGSTLDIGYNPGCVFSMVVSHPNGNGNFRLTTSQTSGSIFDFPDGDFSDFNINTGTTEFYTTNGTSNTIFILPYDVTSYGTVILSPLGGSNLIMPNNSYTTIYGDLITRGQNADSWLAMTWGGAAYANSNPALTIVPKTVYIKGNLLVQGGEFGWIANGAATQNIIIDGDVVVSPLAGIDDWGGATNQSMSIGGSLINNANGLINAPAGTRAWCRFTNIPVTFFGTTSASITNTIGTPSTTFGQVIINKGTSQTTTLTCNIGGTLSSPVDNWLTVQNGTFRYMRTDPGTDFTISTTTPFTVPSTAGLYIDYANANNRNILIGNAANNSGDLILSGKLTLIRGNVYIGQIAAPANNNDIEYSGGGASAIEIQGGNLVVNGQVRRNTSTTNGVLNYTQSGGAVIINGNGSNAGYAKLEVLNAGSWFNMSAGTLTIVRGGGTTYGDLYLRPASSSVTGGTIVFTNVIPNTLQNYSLDANTPLNNLTITGAAGAGLNANLGLLVSPLVLNGTLTLSNSQSIFSSNNINVSLKGNLDNSGVYNFGTNKTTFNGGVQVISGSSVTNFNNLNVLSTNSLTVNNNFSVNQDLFIGSGNLILGNKKVILSGNLANNGSYTDDNTTGGISLSGTIQQEISGTGAYGKLEINNSSGAVLSNGIMLQNDLVLTHGIFNINSNLLTLSQNSSIIGVPDKTKMIMSEGVTSSFGVRKYFTAGPHSFTFPVGIAGKYTPAIFTMTANNTVGYINVNPIDNSHPSVLDPMNVLKYYWQIESSGISGINGSLLLQYLPGDVFGVESDYVAARLELPGSYWYKAPVGPATDNVNEITHQITYNYTGSSNLSGDYTAGKYNAIPDELADYRSNKDGDWSDETIWTPVGSSPPCPSSGPSGSNVIIDHVVTTDINNISVISTTVNNELRIVSSTFGHNLGIVSGNGKIYVEKGNLPGGNYDSFVDCSGSGTIEYGGTGNYTIIASQFSNLPNIFVTGTGTRVLPNKDLTICKRLVIDGPALDNSVNNSKLIIRGTMERYNTGTFISGSGVSPASTVTFAGTSVQTLGGPTGDFAGANSFNNLEINNAAGLNIGVNGLVEVSNNLLLTNGRINTTSANKLTLVNTSSSAVVPVGGSFTSFVNGPFIKQIVNGDNFLFPIGKGIVKGHNFTLTSSAGSTLYWTIEYFTPNPTAHSLTPPLQVSNTMEYWSVSTTTGATAKVKIAWDPLSDLTPLMTVNGMADMRVTDYNAGSWNELTSTASGDNDYGDVATINNVTISSTPKNFTTASITTTIARASLSPTGPVCGAAGIPVSFASFNPINLYYTLDYTINGAVQPTINVTSLPYTLPTPVPGAYKLTGFTYNNGANIGVVDGIIVNAYANPPVSNAGLDQSLCGVSGTVLAGNNPAPYSGLWTIVSGAGGTFINSTLNTTVFTGVLGQTYTLRWTISNVTCTSSDEVSISFPVVASRPSNFTSAPTPVCQGSSGNVYTVPNVSGNTYNWSYSGTGHTINGTGNSVTINFNATATSGTLSVTATNACGTSPARTVNITVTPFPVATFSYTGTPFCQNSANPLPTFSGGGRAGIFSSTPGLVFVNTATGEVNLAASTSGSYIVTNTVAASGGCGVVTATSPIAISGLIWTGASGTNWNVPGNWSCGFIPFLTTVVQIPNVPNKPVLTTGATGTVNNLTIETGSSLFISGNTLLISGTITNNGTFDASNGTILMNGSSAQTIGASVFTGNTIRNLTISNAAGVSLLGPLNVTGIVNIQNGNLASAGNLTLVSSASGTSLIDGSGAGTVTGNVTLQRYLSSAYGYKYVSSPFQAATVNEFGDDLDLSAFFPTFYRYNEGSSTSGWVDYLTTANPLNPLEGYAANFGSSAVPLTADITGVVNNGALSVTLYNHNNTYTQGFNLVGNPYPSPVDWDAPAGWTKTNIDDALYYFKASATDEYGGTYSTYINKISSDGLATAIIPSMQGFFIHVSDGSYPVTGTLGLNNSVRITDLTHSFLKSEKKGQFTLIRLGANFADDITSTDPMVIYFDEKAQTGFDSYLDALKLMNTDYYVPNLYAWGADGTKLSIDALPENQDTLCTIPLGLKTNIDGYIVFRIINISDELPGMKINISDMVSGTENDLLNNNEYKVYLEAGEYKDRFFLNISEKGSEIPDTTSNNNLFSVYSSHGVIKVYVNTEKTGSGLLSIYNLAGQALFVKKILESGYFEFNPGIKNGIYIVNFVSKTYQDSKKIFILK
jgi:hypothetical protein